MNVRFSSAAPRNSHLLLFAIVWLIGGFCLTGLAPADEPAWIWTPQNSGITGVKPEGQCFFRKKFTLVGPQKAELIFAAGDEYEIYMNGRLVSRGQSFGQQTKIDVSRFILPGVNLIAAKIRHYEGERVGLSMRFRVKEAADVRWRSLQTDNTWKTRTTEVKGWQQSVYNDMAWVNAQTVSPANNEVQSAPKQLTSAKKSSRQNLTSPQPLNSVNSIATLTDSSANKKASGQSQPQTNELRVVTSMGDRSKSTKDSAKDSKAKSSDKRFEVADDFEVQQIMADRETGSLIAMEFNEFGKLLLSQEGGPLMIADVSKPEGHPERIRTYCKQVNTCQGILPLNGDVYVTANGPSGLGLYKLSDPNNDGELTIVDKLVGFTGKPGEHGPHGIQLGPDGMLYVVVGNDSQLIGKADETSPYRNYFEGDLVPRFEDPGGHAQGVKVPGGTIVRVSLDGSKVERVAGGIRNAYDLAFDKNGEPFIHDSDMESDIGTTWYRPTMIFHAAAGAEMGWRSGWAKYPEYFADQTPPVASTGRGSPTGIVSYQHIQFPAKYHNALFFADWSEGRILSLKPTPSGAGFTGKPTTFIKGRPLNVCDMTVGEDGGLYFCTGGRGTAGGVFRVIWKGEIPEELYTYKSDLAKVLRHPQPDAAWARQNIAEIRAKMGQEWGDAIQGVANETRNSANIRVRALQMMVLYGPSPSESFLKQLSVDHEPEVRAQIAKICSLKKDEGSKQLLVDMITDKSPYVRRVVCESCIRCNATPNYQALLPMLASLDRVEANAARRVLERIPAETYQAEIWASEDKRIFINGSIAMMTSEPTLPRAYQVLARSTQLMDGFINDRDFVDLLRTMQITLVRGKVDHSKISGLTTRVINEFPSNSTIINRELARLLGYLKAGEFDGRLETYLQDSKVSTPEKVHVAMFLVHCGENLSQSERVGLVDALETARTVKDTGGSYDQYVQRAIEKVSASVAGTDIQTVLKNGHRWPKTALTAFYKLPVKIDEATEQAVIELDQRIAQGDKNDLTSQQVRLGVIAILARDGDAKGMNYLRELWKQEPERRNDIVIGLSQQPAGENWAYLVSSLDRLDDLTSVEVMEKLATVTRRPREAKHYRTAIEIGHRLRGKGAEIASKLIQHWSGESILQPNQSWKEKLDICSNWYQQRWPDETPINSKAETKVDGTRYSVAMVLDQVTQSGLGDSHRGQQIFTQAQCASCHRVGSNGAAVGPDLSNLASRFSLREAIESTIHPSAVVPDRYSTKTILTVDGVTINGMTVQQPDGSYFVLQSDGQRIRINPDDIEAMKDNPESAMPAGLLDELSISEVADLFAYLMKSSDTQQSPQQAPRARISAMPKVEQVNSF